MLAEAVEGPPGAVDDAGPADHPADLAAVMGRLDQIAELLGQLVTQPKPSATAGDYLDARAVAVLLTCSLRFVRTWGEDGTIPAPIAVGRRKVWNKADIEEHLARKRKARVKRK